MIESSDSRFAGRLALAVAFMAAVIRPAGAAFTYPDCADAAESQFTYVPMVGRSQAVIVAGASKPPKVVDGSLLEPLHLAFDSRADGKADIYWVERRGAVKRFDAGTSQVTSLGSVSGITTSGEFGVSGITLDPAFKTNRRMYIFYANNSPAEFRLARFTLNASGMLDMSAQQVLLSMPRSGGNHTGGAMAFDSYGDLWITVGKNAPDYPNSYHESIEGNSTETTSSNLADLRGGVLRIHPDNSAKGYSIPEGNFGSYWSAWFRSQNRADLADEYANPTSVRPELYVKGTRNAYSISVHPTKRWLAWGEFGVNTTNTYTEEHNLVTRPAFGGYPYFAGGFGPGAGTGFYPLWSNSPLFESAHPGQTQAVAAPVNRSKWNKGPRELPPVLPALHTYIHGAGAGAVTGPLYVYDPASPSRIKWPPHFEGAWFVTDWVQGEGNNGFKGIKVFKLNAAGDAKVDSVKWFQNLGWRNPISFDQGPDGALYVINYDGSFGSSSGTHIGRLEYTGDCLPTTVVNVAATPPSPVGFGSDQRNLWVTESGPTRLTLRDAAGRLLFAARQDGPARYSLAGRIRSPGIYLATLESSQGARTLKLARP